MISLSTGRVRNQQSGQSKEIVIKTVIISGT
jgi:hypothetical protein